MSALLRLSMKAVMVANALAGMNSSVSAETYEFRFWPAPSASKDPRFIEMHDGPCGQVATARVRTMPKYSSQEPLAPERVFEVDLRGKTLRSWNIPVDSELYGIDGNDLLFSFNTAMYRVTTQGVIQRASSTLKATQAEPVECKVPSAFQGSAYARCWRHSDIRTKQARILAYQGICI